MSKSKRLAPVIKFSNSREREAAKELAKYKDVLGEQQDSLNALLAYRNEYRRRFHSGNEHGVDAGKLRDYRVFLGRLADAINQQQQRVYRAQADYQEQRRRWLASREKQRALDKVLVRYRRQELAREERQEQEENDDRAQRRPAATDGNKD